MRQHTRTFPIVGSIVLAILVGLAGCSSGSGDRVAAPSASSSATTSATGEPSDAGAMYTPDELGAALLTAADLGQGWTQTQRDVFTTREPENPSVEQSLSLCPDAADQVKALATFASDAGADVELQQGQGRGTMHLVRQQAWSDDQVQQYFTTLAKALDICSGTTWSDPDGGTVSMAALDVPQIGDETTSVGAQAMITSPDGDTAWRSRLTAARFGAALMAVSDTIVMPADRKFTDTDPDWATIVNTAATTFSTLAAN